MFDGIPYLWLADCPNYSSAPKLRSDERSNKGTYAPITSFSRPLANKSIADAADWIKHTLEDVDIDRRFFAVLDEHSDFKDTIQLCRVGDGDKEGEKGRIQ